MVYAMTSNLFQIVYSFTLEPHVLTFEYLNLREEKRLQLMLLGLAQLPALGRARHMQHVVNPIYVLG